MTVATRGSMTLAIDIDSATNRSGGFGTDVLTVW